MGSIGATYRFTAEEFHRMAAAGVFTEDDRVELLEGAITVMSPIGHRHAAVVDFLSERLGEALRRRVLVRVQSPVRLGPHTEPQPDIALLRRAEDYYRSAHPTARDVWLIVEVADAGVEYDRARVRLYAEAGVPEVWIIDLAGDQIEVYRAPRSGRYEEAITLRRGADGVPGGLPGGLAGRR
ncbi:MAG TPA: Uma2 family endonuclease [Candidatus Binatia bacterium]|nr:Uma2 family endonuclease [Candidatus Binatia bacterium]